ncbi:MAG: histidine phosphatase family protein [Pseudomonadota bacterium]
MSQVHKRRVTIDRRRFLGASAAFVFLPRAARAHHSTVIPALREGGHIVYFRHAATQWSGIDRIEWPRERQRLLSAEGERQARVIGTAWEDLDIPIGEVWTSPFARCADHARISFGRAREDMRLIGLLSDDAGRAERIAFLRDLVTKSPEVGTNRVIVAHRSNIAEVAGIALEEGEGAVLTPDSSGGFASRGTFMPDAWTS